MEAKVLKRLEEMAENPEGILSICVEEGCEWIRIPPKDVEVISRSEENPDGLLDRELLEVLSKYWVDKKDAPELHERVVNAYESLGFQKGISGTYCPDHFDPLLR